ncbi:hypothetical protein [Bacteroides sp. UBA939]|uniref:hypothetical protein n=1 Tax=Bacteroides sp. UBA939 TaxID=1946092 RepID=UPI0025BC0F40|nr:hypothetical protein [Bacteroides sp. UBA939]
MFVVPALAALQGDDGVVCGVFLQDDAVAAVVSLLRAFGGVVGGEVETIRVFLYYDVGFFFGHGDGVEGGVESGEDAVASYGFGQDVFHVELVVAVGAPAVPDSLIGFVHKLQFAGLVAGGGDGFSAAPFAGLEDGLFAHLDGASVADDVCHAPVVLREDVVVLFQFFFQQVFEHEFPGFFPVDGREQGGVAVLVFQGFALFVREGEVGGEFVPEDGLPGGVVFGEERGVLFGLEVAGEQEAEALGGAGGFFLEEIVFQKAGQTPFYVGEAARHDAGWLEAVSFLDLFLLEEQL